MVAKPSAPYDSPPTWATNAAYADGEEVGSPTKVQPPTAQEEDGWRPGQRPPPGYQNFHMHAVGLWLGWAEQSIDVLNRPSSGGLRIGSAYTIAGMTASTKIAGFTAIHPSAGAVVDGVVLPSPADDEITVEAGGDGVYRVDFHLPTNSVSDPDFYVFAVYVNGAITNVRSTCKATGANLDHPPIAFGLLELEEGDTVDVRVSATPAVARTVEFSSQGLLMLQRVSV